MRERSGQQGLLESARRGDFAAVAAGRLWGVGAQDLSDATINDVAVHNAIAIFSSGLDAREDYVS